MYELISKPTSRLIVDGDAICRRNTEYTTTNEYTATTIDIQNTGITVNMSPKNNNAIPLTTAVAEYPKSSITYFIIGFTSLPFTDRIFSVNA